MMMHITDATFDLALTGFDANRDLYLDVKVRNDESSSARQNGKG